METYVLTEGLKILIGISTGVALGVLYSLISLIRCGIGCGTVAVALTDVIFGVFSTLVIFIITFIFNSGVLRAYIIVSVICGFVIPLLLTGRLRLKVRRKNARKGLAATVPEKDRPPEGIDN